MLNSLHWSLALTLTKLPIDFLLKRGSWVHHKAYEFHKQLLHSNYKTKKLKGQERDTYVVEEGPRRGFSLNGWNENLPKNPA